MKIINKEFLPKTIVIGAHGYIGKAFYTAYQQFDPTVLGTHYHQTPCLRWFDLAAPDLNALKIDPNHYNSAVITAGITNLYYCEENPSNSRQVNVLGTLRLVEQLCKKNITPVLFSSDYVFDGHAGSYDELSPMNPINEYGKQKFELEQEITKCFKDHCLIVRLTKVYGLQKGDNTLIDQIANSLINKKIIRAAYDQIFSPISLDDLVSIVIQLQKMKATGLYNISGKDKISRLELAQAVCHALRANEDLVQPISLDDLKEPFHRPKRTDLINHKVLEKTGFQMKKIQFSVETIVQQYLMNSKQHE